jgi:hypothetical protein
MAPKQIHEFPIEFTDLLDQDYVPISQNSQTGKISGTNLKKALATGDGTDGTPTYQGRISGADVWVNSESGSDTNDGLSENTPFASIQRAIECYSQEMDLKGEQGTIHLIDSSPSNTTFNENLTLLPHNGSNVRIYGNTAPDTFKVRIDGRGIQNTISAKNIQSSYTIENLFLMNSNNNGWCLSYLDNSFVRCRDIIWGNCENSQQVYATNASRFYARNNVLAGLASNFFMGEDASSCYVFGALSANNGLTFNDFLVLRHGAIAMWGSYLQGQNNPNGRKANIGPGCRLYVTNGDINNLPGSTSAIVASSAIIAPYFIS